MNKTFFKCLMAIAVCIVSFPSFAYNLAITNEYGVKIYYNYINNKTELEVTYYNNDYNLNKEKYIGAVIIPSIVEYKGTEYNVTSISSNAFSGCSGLTSITLPEGVTRIGIYAFHGCSGLKKVIVPNIAAWCNISFAGPTSNPLSYAHHLYSDEETEITNVEIPEGVESIGNSAFKECSGLTSVTIPESVTSIGDDAFNSCSGLTSVNIPESVTSIGDDAFNSCSGLTSVNIPESVTSIGQKAFLGCSGLTSINIPEGVTRIGSNAFRGCSGLTSINIPESVTDIDWSTFSGCSGLSSVTINCPRVLSWFSGLTSIKEVTLGEKVTTIGYQAFYNCIGLTSITIPESVTNITNDAFSGCKNLTTVFISDINKWCNITFGNTAANPLSVARHLYMNDKEITKLVIPNGTEKISDYAFVGCEGLTSVVIPNSVKSIGQRAFQDCINLYSVTSLINIPFKLDESTFIYTNEDYDESTIYMITTLYVPRGRDAVYSKVDGWKNFLNIQPTYTKFKLTYLLDDAPYKEYEIQATEVVTPEPDPVPTQEGYIFSGWSEIPWYMPAEDVVVKGSFIVDPDYDAIQDVQSDSSATPVSYYSLDGKLLSKPQQGLNIVRTKDGKTRKLIVR